jgi:two-component system cell cycle response regulator
VAVRILIIEDNAESAQQMASLLAARGHEPLSARDLASALELARLRRPALVLCDQATAGQDAATFPATLKRDAALSQVPVLALAREGASLPTAGYDGQLAKPIEPDGFLAGVERFLPAPTLLLVDDDPFMLELLADLLGGEGWRIRTAQSGEEGLELLAGEGAEVVVCDQCMPGMSGAEFAARVQALYPRTVRIMLSAQSGTAPIAAALASGAVDRQLAKPWSAALLRAALHEAFALQRQRAQV